MVNAFRGASTWLFHPMVGSEMIARRSMLPMSRALFFPDAKGRCVMNRQAVIERLRRKRPRKISSVFSCAHAGAESSITKRSVVVARSEGEDPGTACQVVQRAFAV